MYKQTVFSGCVPFHTNKLISSGANTIYEKFMNDDHNLRHLMVDN